MLASRWLSHIATVGLILILGLMTVFALWAALTSQTLSQRADTALIRDDQYQQASYWLSEENRYQTLYRLRPSAAVNAQYQQAGLAFLTALQQGLTSGSVVDAQFVNTIIDQHAVYQAMTEQEFAAVDLLDQARIVTTSAQSDAAIALLETQLNQEAQANHQVALQRLADLERTQQMIVVATPLIFLPGFGLVLLFVVMLRIYRRKHQENLEATLLHRMQEAASQAELARLQHSALTDNLTQLGNHRAYQEARQREIAQAQRHQEPLSLALIDIDEFKQYNDQYGHAYGDHILTTLSSVLRQSPQDDQAFRLGGDEFAMLLRQSPMENAVQILEQLRATVQQQLAGVTISIGIAELAPNAENADILQEQADAALYEAKRRGRNTLVPYSEIASQVALLTSAQAQAIRNLLVEKRLQIAFQPIWDLVRETVLGYEALMRPDAGYGFAGPQEAFDIAERMGHAHELDAITREAILARAHELPHQALLFLNVTPQTLDHDMLAGTSLIDAVMAAGLSPQQIVLEITERSVARPEVVVREAERLRSLGFKLALDDAGAGNAGLEMLSHMAVDFVKIDRSVIAKSPSDFTARAVLAGIMAIARETNSYVIAEGIEDQATLQFIQSFGKPEAGSVHGVQGYLLGRPSLTIPTASELQDELLQAA